MSAARLAGNDPVVGKLQVIENGGGDGALLGLIKRAPAPDATKPFPQSEANGQEFVFGCPRMGKVAGHLHEPW